MKSQRTESFQLVGSSGTSHEDVSYTDGEFGKGQRQSMQDESDTFNTVIALEMRPSAITQHFVTLKEFLMTQMMAVSQAIEMDEGHQGHVTYLMLNQSHIKEMRTMAIIRSQTENVVFLVALNCIEDGLQMIPGIRTFGDGFSLEVEQRTFQ